MSQVEVQLEKNKTYYFLVDSDNISLDGPSWKVQKVYLGNGMLVHCPDDSEKRRYTTEYSLTEFGLSEDTTVSDIRDLFLGSGIKFYSWVFEKNICWPAQIFQVVTTYEREHQMKAWQDFRTAPNFSQSFRTVVSTIAAGMNEGAEGAAAGVSPEIEAAVDVVDEIKEQLSSSDYLTLMSGLRNRYQGQGQSTGQGQGQDLTQDPISALATAWSQQFGPRDDVNGAQLVDLDWADHASKERIEDWN